MNIPVNARTLFLALILGTCSIGYTFAQNKVVVIPLDGETKKGISGYEINQTISSINPINNELSVTADCSPGKKVIGGGGRESLDLVIVDSYPDTQVAWTVAWEKRAGAPSGSVGVTVFAICAEVI